VRLATTPYIWRTAGCFTASDDRILAAAAEDSRTIVSADADFGVLLAPGGHEKPSVVLLRSADQLTPAGQADLLVANLPAVTDDLECGAIVTFARSRARVRLLPIVKKPPPNDAR
jgi:predicted nuclease of predicted toxin-antitoxin system